MEEININNYCFDKPLTSDNSGFSKWGIGKRGSTSYFVKEFLSPTYPVDESIYTEKQKKDRIELCDRFVQSKIQLYNAVRSASNGNLVAIEQFFRVGSKYYISTKAIEGNFLSVRDIAERPFKDRLRICCSVAHSMIGLHAQRVVHADIKPDNILIINKKVPQAKIIDFDCSFFEYEAPKLGEELNGDMVYLSPEAFLHIAGIESNLSCKADIFALGILFCQYMTGEMPIYDTDEYQYPYEVALDERLLSVNLVDDIDCRKLLTDMLAKDPEKRPAIDTVFNVLNEKLLSLLGRTPAKKIRGDKSEANPYFHIEDL